VRDTQVREDIPHLVDQSDPISSFAARVLDVLVERSRPSAGAIRRDLVHALADGMVTQDEARIEATLRSFRKACISPAAMSDIYVPAAARLLGTEWSGDRMGFSEVTIATARLQALVRAIGTRWGGDVAHVPGRRSILMIVPDQHHHTLGAVVATGQLRRLGLSVCLRLGPSRAELIKLLLTRTFDAVMVSVGHSDRLEASRKVVESVRGFAPAGMPVIAGGAVETSHVELKAQTGVDLVTCDIGEALAFCRLQTVGAADLCVDDGSLLRLR
jgi:methylmalonyl-CoA mutase cobalamin-binding subunit